MDVLQATAVLSELPRQRTRLLDNLGRLRREVGPITPELNRRILELCSQTGLKAIVQDPRLGAAGAAGESAELDAALDTVVGEYGKSPALLGYFLQDEPQASQFPRLAALDR